MVARPCRCSGEATDGLSVERGPSLHLKWLVLQLVRLARVLLVGLCCYGREGASCFSGACRCWVEGMWGQHGGREARKPNFVICSQMPYRCAMGPMSNPHRKARDTVVPTSVECAWAWGAKAAGHRTDPCMHACIDTSTPLPSRARCHGVSPFIPLPCSWHLSSHGTSGLVAMTSA